MGDFTNKYFSYTISIYIKFISMTITDVIISETIEFIKEHFNDEESLADKMFNKKYNQVPKTNKAVSDPSMGELIGYVYKDNFKILKEPIVIYKNPKTLRFFGNDTRAILTNKIDLYVATSYEGLHRFILDILVDKNILSYDSTLNYMEEMPEEFIALRRAGGSNTFGQGRYISSLEEYTVKFPKYYHMMFEYANKKFPFEFKIYDNLSEIIDPNTMIGNIPNQHLDGMPDYDGGILY